ncbi:MAG: hypothetical protein Unbinned200contig1000_61 [Prokaryotic dsDNA virus sp.]|jgi:hypothetical protein|nr:MAG: hypothetical protein Unbinned200contig1000_61 [Prokaryotic dsDNA virus sp.]|tara:strand:+ start:5224 stop:5436 length:213 start_codon:yes stop_codon:yes gene_type:complete
MTIADPSSHPERVTWVHKKTGKMYVILHHGLLESSLEPVVIYQQEDGGPVWVRPAEEFFDGRFQSWDKKP